MTHMEVENDKIQYPDMGATLESQHQGFQQLCLQDRRVSVKRMRST